MPNQKQFFKVVASTEATSQLAIDKLTSGKRILYVFGEVCYKDIFHHPHHTTFCESISPDLKTFQNCQTYNEADDEPHDCK
jgi:hypothetical protein